MSVIVWERLIQTTKEAHSSYTSLPRQNSVSSVNSVILLISFLVSEARNTKVTFVEKPQTAYLKKKNMDIYNAYLIRQSF